MRSGPKPSRRRSRRRFAMSAGMASRARRSPVRRRWTGHSPFMSTRAGAKRAHSIACATGAFRASAIGAARSRFSTARPAASCRKRARTCPSSCPTTSISTGRAIRSTDTRPGGRQPARNAAGLRCAKPTRWTPSSIPRGISPASPRPAPTSRPIRRPPMPGCRSTSISAASSTRSCISSIRASSCGR